MLRIIIIGGIGGIVMVTGFILGRALRKVSGPGFLRLDFRGKQGEYSHKKLSVAG